MNRISILLLSAISLMVACKNTPSDTAEIAEAKEVAKQTGATYQLDEANSSLIWTATHKGGLNPRYGTVKASGTVAVENNNITGGSFVIDMNSFKVDSNAVAASEGKTAMDLEGHLKNADFFEVSKYPTAQFDITNVAPFDSTKAESVIEGATHIISGNLKLKDKVVNVTFPAKVTVTETNVTATSKFSIDRKEWGLSYKTEGNPADWGISKDVVIEMKINANKK